MLTEPIGSVMYDKSYSPPLEILEQSPMQPATMNFTTPTLSRTASGNGPSSQGTMRRAFNPANSQSMAAKGQGEFGLCEPISATCSVIATACGTCLGVLALIGTGIWALIKYRK